MDPWIIQPAEKSRFHAQFQSLNPVDNHVTGDQAKGLFLKSGLPVQVLGKIWTLADRDADGRMDISEFSIACKLITLKLKGQEVPATLPPSLLSSSAGSTAPSPTSSLPSAMLSQNFIQPSIPATGVGGTSNVNLLMNGNNLLSQAPMVPPIIPQLPVMPMTAVGSGVGALSNSGVPLSAIPPVPAPPLMSTVPMTAVPIVPAHPQSLPIDPIRTVSSLPSQDSQCSQGSVLSPTDNWSVPHSTKLKNTQLFNTHDRVKSGFLSGPQARHILVQTGLPQAVLAQIWTLADVSSDGKLSCDEFVVAMHLCDLVRAGGKLPAKLPADLVPPQYRKTRLNSQGSLQDVMSGGETPDDVKIIPAMMTSDSRQDSQTDVTFEDKRKENFERGQAELERRRRALLEIQQREEEERQRKEREEHEKRERIRLEAEEKRRQEMERQLARQRELEAQREEERRRKLEQQEAARKEMERQRQLEWEKQRRQELLQQRQKEQEKVLQLKAQNQKLAIELTQVNDKVKELTGRIGDTREGVTAVKSVIDGMRTTRDTKVAEMNRYKALLKEHNAALLQLVQEKSRLQDRNKVMSSSWHDDTVNNIANTVVNRTLALKQLRDKLALYGEEKRQKILDLETASGQLEDLKDQLHQLIISSKSVYSNYQLKRGEVYNMKYSTKPAWDVSAAPVHTSLSGNRAAQTQKYRVVYQFDARNEDELSLVPGDIVLVHHDRPAEPHWLVGELDNGKSGWFPESYVEPCEGAVDGGLEEIAEVPEQVSFVAVPSSEDAAGSVSHLEGLGTEEDTQLDLFQGNQVDKVIGTDWSGEQEDQLTVRVGDVVSVTQDQDGWSYGKLGSVTGWFPTSCVKTEGEYCVALYHYHSQEDADLNFTTGDVILVVKKDGDWWTGTLNSKTGIFPYNYVQPHTQDPSEPVAIEETVTTQIKSKKPEIATVIAPYQPTGEGQLSLQRGQLILVKRKTNSGWWEGELQAKGKKRQMGWFPASYVKLMGNPKGHSESTDVSDTVLDKDDPPIPDSAPPQLEAARDSDWSQQTEGAASHGSVEALYPYTAQNTDELSFQKGDVIRILDNSDPAWWKGEMNGREGMFPCNYVGPLKEDDGSGR